MNVNLSNISTAKIKEIEMQDYKITAWPIDESEREYNPTWESTLKAETISEAQTEGYVLFKE